MCLGGQKDPAAGLRSAKHGILSGVASAHPSPRYAPDVTDLLRPERWLHRFLNMDSDKAGRSIAKMFVKATTWPWRSLSYRAYDE